MAKHKIKADAIKTTSGDRVSIGSIMAYEEGIGPEEEKDLVDKLYVDGKLQSKIIINKTEADILTSGSGDDTLYYLPLLDNDGNALPSGAAPYSIQVNQDGITTYGSTIQKNDAWSEPRVFLANNDPQTITIFAI